MMFSLKNYRICNFPNILKSYNIYNIQYNNLKGGCCMEFTIKKIISIDKDAENYRKTLELKLLNEKKNLETTLAGMRNDSKKNLEEVKRKVMEQKLNEAKKMAEQISNEKITEMEDINKKVNAVKEKIVIDTVNNILNSR